MRTLLTYGTDHGSREVLLLDHAAGGYTLVDAIGGRSLPNGDLRIVAAGIETIDEAHDLATEYGLVSALIGRPAHEDDIRFVLEERRP